MSIIVETGAVVAGADSYISVADANTYHAAYGNTAWDLLDDVEQKEPCLRQAAQFMLQMYRSRWKGFRKDAKQTLDWPRSFVYLEPFIHGAVEPYPYLVSDTIVPVEVQKAAAELALAASVAPLYPDAAQRKTSVSIGPLSVQYDRYSPPRTQYDRIDALLGPLLLSTGTLGHPLEKA